MIDLKWNYPNPVAVVTAMSDGKYVELGGDGGTRCRAAWHHSMDILRNRSYRIVEPEEKTYTGLEAAQAYFGDGWIAESTCMEWWNHKLRPMADPVSALAHRSASWLIRDTDPRELEVVSKPKISIGHDAPPLNEPSKLVEKGPHGFTAALPNPPPRQVDVHEAVRVYVAYGTVKDPKGNKRTRSPSVLCDSSTMLLVPEWVDGPWTILEEPPCPTN